MTNVWTTDPSLIITGSLFITMFCAIFVAWQIQKALDSEYKRDEEFHENNPTDRRR